MKKSNPDVTGSRRTSVWKILIPAVLAALLLLLFFPIPKGSYDDGGTQTYDALLYKIVRWNKLNVVLNDHGDEPESMVYRHTSFYFYPDNTKSYEELWKIEQARYGK